MDHGVRTMRMDWLEDLAKRCDGRFAAESRAIDVGAIHASSYQIGADMRRE